MFTEKYTCGRCGKPVNKDSISCPHCGVYFSGTRQINRPAAPASTGSTKLSKGCVNGLVIGTVVICIVGAIFIFSRKDTSEKARDGAKETVAGPATAAVVEPPTATPPAGQSIQPEENLYERALAGEFRGREVTMMAPGDPGENNPLSLTLDQFSADTGIAVSLELLGNDDLAYASRLQTVLQAGSFPDVILIRDFTLLAKLASENALLDVRDVLGEEILQQRYDPVWLKLMMMPGPERAMMAGVWHTFFPGRIVYYARDNFAAAGYLIPRTWQQLVDLSDQIVSAGETPWCLGIENSIKHDWIIISWLKEILLRTQPLQAYEALETGTLETDSPEIQRALEYLGSIWFKEGYLYRDPNPPENSWLDNLPMFLVNEPPECWMFMDDSFVGNDFYMGDYGNNYDWFLLPGIDETYGQPREIWGNAIAVSENRPEVGALLDFFTRSVSTREWLKVEAGLSPHRDSTPDLYADPFIRSLAERYTDQATFVLANSTTTDWSAREQLLARLNEFIDAGMVVALGPPPAERTANVIDLLDEGSISVDATGRGIDELDLDIKNLIDDLLNVEIPAGTYFVAASGGEQNMVVRRTQVIQIDPGELVSTVLDAACAEMQDEVPADETGFSLQRSGSDSLSKLMPVLEDANVEYDVAQAAVWIVTNNADYDDLGTLVSGWGYSRVILEDEAARAMQLVDEAGLDITNYRIWADREMIAAEASPELARWLRER